MIRRFLKTHQEVEIMIEIIRDMENAPGGYHKIPSRKREIAEPRQIAMFFTAEYFRGVREISSSFDRHYSSLTKARKAIKDRMDVDKTLRTRIEFINRAIADRFSLIKANV